MVTVDFDRRAAAITINSGETLRTNSEGEQKLEDMLDDFVFRGMNPELKQELVDTFSEEFKNPLYHLRDGFEFTGLRVAPGKQISYVNPE